MHPQVNVETIVSQPFSENTYAAHIRGKTDCIVVDPGLEPGLIFRALEDLSLLPIAILNTHGHADHIGGNAAMKDRFPDCPLYIGSGDADKLTDPAGNLSGGFGVPLISPPADVVLTEGDVVSAGGMDLKVYDTPGHSAGHVVFVFKDHSPWLVFGGDVLFQHGIGRSDFPDGDAQALVQSIHEKLFTMPDDTIVLPGHGPPTTIGEEKRQNPFVGEAAGFHFPSM